MIALIIKSTILYVLAYFVSGAIAYPLLTKPFYMGSDPFFNFLRNEQNAIEWSHTMTWMLPVQLLRGALIVSAFLPFRETLRTRHYWPRTWIIAGVLFVLFHLASVAPSPSNIEGFLYLKERYFGLRPFLLTQPEMILQTVSFAMGFSYFIKKTRS